MLKNRCSIAIYELFRNKFSVKSHRGTQFCIWATQQLCEYITKSFAMDDDRLKQNGWGNYFDGAVLAVAIADPEQTNPNDLDLEQIKNLTTYLIISGSQNDLPYHKTYTDKSKYEASI